MSRRTLSFFSAIACGALVGLSLPAHAAARSENYQTYCSVCHGDDGKADTEQGKKKGARDFTNKKWQSSVDDKRLVESVTKGKGKMPKFGGKLSDDEIKALVAEVRAIGKGE